MTAFAAAARVLVADPHLSIAATYRAGGEGSGVPVRVVRSAADETAAAFDAAVISATDILFVAATDVPDCAAGDTFALGAETLTVQAAWRDATGASWRIACRRG